MMEEQPSARSLRDLALVVVRQRHVIGAVYAAIVATAVAGVFLLPPHYRAAAKVLVTGNRAQISTSAERPTELIRSGSIGQPELNSQLEILRSRELVEQVLADMGVGSEAPAGRRLISRILGAPANLLRAAYRRLHGLHGIHESPTAAVATVVLETTETAALKNSNVIEIAFTGPDPQWARTFVERLTAAYIERQARMQREEDAENFFTRQSDILRQKLSTSEAQLREAREKAGTLAGQQADVHERLNEFSGELARTKIARAEQEERVGYLDGTRSADRPTGRTATPELLALEAKRVDLLGRYRADSERVRAVDEQIRALRGVIGSYQTVTSGVGAGNEATDLTAARASLAALRGREEALGREQEEYRKRAELLDAQSFDLARLERQVKLDEETYLSYVRTAEQSRLSNALEQNKMLRLNIVEPATVPLVPVSPNKGQILFFALVGGLAVSVGCGFARDQLDTSVKTAGDVRRCGNLEVLAVLSDRA
jgi:uncharacterized protein involved in exopolysaccharide biosynthesis